MMNDPNGLINPVARKSGLVIQEMPDELLVYDFDTDKAHCLNSSAAFVWKCCDGKTPISDIVTQFQLNGGGLVTEDFVWLAIEQLMQNGLLENEITPKFYRRSRRQILKTIGMTSTVAFPIIASLVSPRKSYAEVSCGCTSNFQCSQPQNAACPSTTNCTNLGLCAPNPTSRKS